MSWVLTRSRLPLFRTLPSSTAPTSSLRPTSCTSGLRPLNWKDEVRAATRSAGHLAQRGDQLLGEPVAEILLVLFRAQVHERQHRGRRGAARSGRLAPAKHGMAAERREQQRETDETGRDSRQRRRGRRSGAGAAMSAPVADRSGCSAAANSAAVENRSAGDRASARVTARSSAGGTSRHGAHVRHRLARAAWRGSPAASAR